MKLDVPTGTTFYYNPYSPKFYTIVQNSPTTSSPAALSSPRLSTLSSSGCCSDDEGSSFNASSTTNGGAGLLSQNSSFIRSTPEKRHAPTVVSDDVYNLGWATISSVRQEKTTDAAICTMVQRFPFKTLTAMAAVIESSPNLFLELCEKERGNVVSHVISALHGDRCDDLVALTIEHSLRLATDQSGCIALTRIMDGASAAQQEAISVALVQHFDSLVCHQFGNFVLSRIAQGNMKSPCMGYMCSSFESIDMLAVCLNNKFGSHVFEAYAKNCAAPHLFRVCAVLFSDMDFVMEIATSKIANYPLQACLRQMMSHDTNHELSRWALATIPVLVQDTKFATNINRALGFGRTSAEQQQVTMQRTNSSQQVRRSVRASA